MSDNENPTVAGQERTILLVDDEENILASLRRLLRRDGYRILTANSGAEGLNLLTQNRVDVIVSDQRMPHMTGSEFLRQVKVLYPETVRIVLSGYTELQSITDAINEGAIYKFLTKPWEDEQLRANVAEAFHYKELSQENQRLQADLQAANRELAEANEQMRQLLEKKQRQLQRDEASLDIAHEVLQQVPLAVIGFDDENMVVFSNAAADTMLGGGVSLLASFAEERLPAPLLELLTAGEGGTLPWSDGPHPLRAICREMGGASRSRGRLLIFLPVGVP